MARAESKMIMGYLPIEEHHFPALLSLVAPTTCDVRMLDPFAGDGRFLEVAAKAWNVTPYANELDGERAQVCIERFGPKQAVRCDVERLIASNNAFSGGWFNPPYDYDASASGNKRVEFAYLRHSWKWLQDGALALWCIYSQHITEDSASFLAKNSTRVDVWALPGKHLGEYDQIIVAAIKGLQANPETLYEQIMAQKAAPHLLEIQPEPIYKLPAPKTVSRFVFAPDVIDEAQGLKLIEAQGAWKSNGFQALLEVPRPPEQIEPVVAPRPGHMALVLAAGVANGAVIQTEDYGQVAIRGKTQHVEQIARVDVESDPNDPERQVKKTTIRLKPSTTLTLLADNGTLVEMDGDDALLIQRGDLAHIHQFHYQGALSDLMNAIREAEAGLGQVEDNPPVIPDLPEETPKPEPKKKAKSAQKLQPQADEEPTIDIPLKKGVKAVKMSHLKISGGETDAAAYRQAVLIAGKLIAGGLWDGESPIRINDVYATMKKMQHLTNKDFSLFNLEDFVQTGAITEEAVPTDDVEDLVPAITASLNGHHPDDHHPDEASTLL